MSQRQNLDDFRREFTADCSKQRQMRATCAFVIVVVAAALSASACEECITFPEVVAKRRTVGDLQYQIGGEVTTVTGLTLVDGAAFRLANDSGGAYPPGDLSFRVATPGQASSVPPPFLVTIVIHDVPPGPSEIDLDDQRVQLSARPLNVADVPYHGVTGHLSISELSLDCVAGCPTRANGTMDVSAVGPNGEALSFTSVTFTAADEIHEGMCIHNGD